VERLLPPARYAGDDLRSDRRCGSVHASLAPGSPARRLQPVIFGNLVDDGIDGTLYQASSAADAAQSGSGGTNACDRGSPPSSPLYGALPLPDSSRVPQSLAEPSRQQAPVAHSLRAASFVESLFTSATSPSSNSPPSDANAGLLHQRREVASGIFRHFISCSVGQHPFIDGVQPWHLYSLRRAVSSGTSMRSINQRAVALVLIGVVNTACFFALGCAARCVWGSCPQQLNPTPADKCHHRRSAPSHRHDEQQCPGQSLLLAAGLTPSGPDVVSSLQATARVVFSPSYVPSLVGTGPLHATRSHSPPGDLSGRSICRKESLLRI